MSYPEPWMPADPAAPMAPSSVMIPTAMDSPGALVPTVQASIGPLQMLFWGLAGSVAIGVTFMRRRIYDRLQSIGNSLDGCAGSLYPSVTDDAIQHPEFELAHE